jgi:hypothetical protein
MHMRTYRFQNSLFLVCVLGHQSTHVYRIPFLMVQKRVCVYVYTYKHMYDGADLKISETFCTEET